MSKVVLTFISIFFIWNASAQVTIYVVDNGVHTEVVVPIANHISDWREFVPMETIEYPATNRFNYLAFGWGDRGFYIHTPEWEDLELQTAFAALFLPTRTVMKVEGYFAIRPGMYVKEVVISDNEYLQLSEFIRNSFRLNDQQQLMHAAAGHSMFDSFFHARGTYFFLNTSNTWTARALRNAGLRMPRGIVFSWDVMDNVR